MIRSAEPQELTKLAEIYRAAWHYSFSKYFPPKNLAQVTLGDFEHRWRDFFVKKHIHSFVYEENKTPVAFVTCGIQQDKSSEILSMMVSPSSIRLGVGSKLMEKALSFLQDKCRRVELWVVEDNFPARSFYERFAFSKTGDRRFIQRYGIELCQLRYEKHITPF